MARALLIALAALPARAQSPGVLLGFVNGPDEGTIADAQVTLTSDNGLIRRIARSADDGSFVLAGIPPGKYGLTVEGSGFTPVSYRDVVMEPSGVRLVRIRLAPGSSSLLSGPGPVWTELTDTSCRTLIDASQVQKMPSANNLWSLVENQDLSATTNRIDVGGVWASLPALWSSRGSVSWTQSSYWINGLDATDPYITGTPLFYPDLDAFELVDHSNARHPISYLSPGGALDLVPKQGTADYHGSVSASMSSAGMTSNSVPSRLQNEGLNERNKLNSFGNYGLQFSGPLIAERLLVFTSLSRLNINRDVAEFEPDDKGTVSSALVNLTYALGRGSLHLLWTGQAVHHPTAGAGRQVPFSATVNKKDYYNILQLIWRTSFRPNHHVELGAAYTQGQLHSAFQAGILEPHSEEVFRKNPWGAAAAAGRDDRRTAHLQGKGQFTSGRPSRVLHRLDYGLSLRYAESTAEAKVLDNIHLHYLEDEPFEIVRFNTPLRHRENSLETHLFLEDLITFRNLASLSWGFHLVSTRGRAPQVNSSAGTAPPDQQEGGRIDWLNVSPRLGFALPLSRDKSLTLRVSAARYYFELPLQYLAYGNPQAPGGLAYPWTDGNHNGQYEPGEEGALWRREGPFYASIDPGLKRPSTDEFTVSFTKIFGRDLYLTLAGFYRETRHLVETQNVGVPLDSYRPVPLYDAGDDAIPGTSDDLYLTVYDQDKGTLGNDLFLLTNPDDHSRVNRYRGLDLTLVKKYGETAFFFTATAIEAIGTASPGNTEFENDDGVIGALYDNPNASLFAKGRLRFDRAYTARLGLSFPLPLGIRLSGLVKYYDGQPFSRKIIVTGLNQGPFYVQAFSRGVARYEFNMTVDLRIEKTISLGRTRGRIFLEAYNLFDWAMATQENEWTGPEFTLRYATEVQSPRVLRFGVRYEF
jgi:hypothetical protein